MVKDPKYAGRSLKKPLFVLFSLRSGSNLFLLCVLFSQEEHLNNSDPKINHRKLIDALNSPNFVEQFLKEQGQYRAANGPKQESLIGSQVSHSWTVKSDSKGCNAHAPQVEVEIID
jgi:hypothetical protein